MNPRTPVDQEPLTTSMDMEPSVEGLPASSLPTLILRDRHERKERCTIWPLRNRTDVRLVQHPWETLPSLEGYVVLWPEGPELSADDAGKGLFLIDGSWRWATRLAIPFAQMPKRSLQGIRTSYPRSSKIFPDPEGGLATVEALYVAHLIMKKDITGLLDHYHWASQFLQANPSLSAFRGV